MGWTTDKIIHSMGYKCMIAEGLTSTPLIVKTTDPPPFFSHRQIVTIQ